MSVRIECHLSRFTLNVALALVFACFGVSCSAPNPVILPGSAVGSRGSSTDGLTPESSGDANSRTVSSGGEPGTQAESRSQMGAGSSQTEANSFKLGEVTAETLKVFSALSVSSVAHLIASNAVETSQGFSCTFVATDADISQRLLGRVETEGWSLPQQGNLLTRSTSSQLLSTEGCRCMVSKLADLHNSYFVPLSLNFN